MITRGMAVKTAETARNHVTNDLHPLSRLQTPARASISMSEQDRETATGLLC